LSKWQAGYPKLCDWVESNIEETLTYYRLALQHHEHLKSTNMLERINEEIRRRSRVIRVFPSEANCLRLIRALTVETHENWTEAIRSINMGYSRNTRRRRSGGSRRRRECGCGI
jgi:transposase-like protein